MDNTWRRHYHSDPASLKRGEVTVTRRGSKILVAAPFNERSRVGARSILGAKWRAAIKVWSFPDTDTREVGDLIETVFGAGRVPEWMRTWRPSSQR